MRRLRFYQQACLWVQLSTHCGSYWTFPIQTTSVASATHVEGHECFRTIAVGVCVRNEAGQ